MSSNPTAPVPGQNLKDLDVLIKKDAEYSDALRLRIDKTRQDLLDGKPSPERLDVMDSQHREVTKDLVRRIEAIADQEPLAATDRQMLQCLNARLVVLDKLTMQIAELGDLSVAQRKMSEKAKSQGELVRSGTQRTASEAWVEPDEEKHAAFPGRPVPLNPGLRGEQNAADEAVNSSGEDDSDHDDEHDADDEDDYDDDDEDHDEDEETELPLLYRILNVDPSITDETAFQKDCDRQRRVLSLRHSPDRRPNDPDAPTRWAAIQKAHEILSDPERRRFYDLHHRLPAEMEGFDFEKLSLNA